MPGTDRFACTLLLVLSALVLAGCSLQPTPYRPPTVAATTARPAAATSAPASAGALVSTPLPPVTPACTDGLTLLEDLTLPDKTVVKPGESLDKRWLVENSGTCNWNDQYRLKFISGAELQASIDQALYPARSGTRAELRIVFTAPNDPGTYQSGWQAFNPAGQPFGDPLFLRVIVSAEVP